MTSFPFIPLATWLVGLIQGGRTYRLYRDLPAKSSQYGTFWLTRLDKIENLRTEASAEAASNLRAHSESEVGAPVVTGGPHAAAISESSERQRAAKSRRCSARGIESPRPRRQRKYCRNSSNAEQKRAADAKLPKPRIG